VIYFVSIGVVFESVSDLVSVFVLMISMVTLLTTISWNYWHFKKTGDVYLPVAEIKFVEIPTLGQEKPHVLVRIFNIGSKNLVLDSVTLTGSWFQHEISCKNIHWSFIQPKGSVMIEQEVPRIDGQVGDAHHVILKIIDEKSNLRWEVPEKFRYNI
jgi:hypothetical protein